MALQTWNGNITPRDGFDADQYVVTVFWYEIDSEGDLVPGFLASTYPDSSGDFTLQFDDQDIPPSAFQNWGGQPEVPVLALLIVGDVGEFHIFSPYTPDGSPITP